MSDEVSVTEMNTKSQRLVAITLTNDDGNVLRIHKDHEKSTLTITDSNYARYNVGVNDLLDAIKPTPSTDVVELNTKEGIYSVK